MSILRRLRDLVARPSARTELRKARAVELIQRGNALEEDGLLDEAMQAYEAALVQSPGLPRALMNVGNVLLERGRALDAITHYRQALAEDADYASAHVNIGNAYLLLDDRDAALTSYREAARIAPSLEAAQAALDLVSDELGDQDDAESRYRRALARTLRAEPEDASAHWAWTMAQVKPIYEDASDRRQSLADFAHSLAQLDEWFAPERIRAGIRAVGGMQPFHLAYSDSNQRGLLERHGALCCRIMAAARRPIPPMTVTRPLDGRTLRIGFCSAHLWNHSVWDAITEGWVRMIDRSRFEVYVFHVGSVHEELTRRSRHMNVNFYDGPCSVEEWAQTIANAALDVLIYPGIGMDKLTTQLAAQRLAPVQAAAWGHPITTGLPHIDIFLSAELFESADAQDHYSERLVRLANLGVCVAALKPQSQPAALARWGLTADQPIVLCPGMPFKYGPEQDDLWVDLAVKLQASGGGQMVFFHSPEVALMGRQFERRLRRHFRLRAVDFESTVHFIPKLPRAEFYGLMRVSTLMLDTIGFSGFNTALQSLECDLPMVAFEGQFMRGRLAAGLLRRIGLPQWIAVTEAELMQKALALVRDGSANQLYRAQISERKHCLFDDEAPVRHLEQVLMHAARLQAGPPDSP